MIQDSESGFLVSERDVDSHTDRLKYLIERPEFCALLWALRGDNLSKNITTLTGLMIDS